MSKSKWFSWQQLLDRWEIQDFELLKLFRQGLQPYRRPGEQKIGCHDQYHEYTRKYERCREAKGFLRALRELDDLEREIKKSETDSFHVKRIPLIIQDYLEDRGFDLPRDGNKGYPVTPEIIKELKKLRSREGKIRKNLKNELYAIDKDERKQQDEKQQDDSEPQLQWKYLVWPLSDQEIENIISELELEKAIFQRNNVLELERHEDAKLSLRIISVIQKAKREIEMIYDAMKKDVGFSGRIEAPEKAWAAKAKEVFDKQEKCFQLIKEKYLSEDIYCLNPGKEKRDFTGALLTRIVKDQTGQIIGGQRLYEQYKRND